MWTNFHIFNVKFRRELWQKLNLKLAGTETITFPQICCRTTVPCEKCSTVQLYSTVNSDQNGAKAFNYSKCQ